MTVLMILSFILNDSSRSYHIYMEKRNLQYLCRDKIKKPISFYGGKNKQTNKKKQPTKNLKKTFYDYDLEWWSMTDVSWLADNPSLY